MFEPYANYTRFSTYAQVESYLNKLDLFHMNFGLNRMTNAVSALFPNGLPYKVVQIVGTNGKGSTAHFLASIAGMHGLTDGLFTSPHLLTLRERVRLKGRMLSEKEWLACANIVDAAQGQEKERLTYFEFVCVLALTAFARAGVKLAVLEAGLGGEYDATSAIFADLLLFTPISYDHEQILGETISDIANSKAGAIKPGQILLTTEQTPEVTDILRAKAAASGNRLLKPALGQVFDYQLGMFGCQQKENARLALAGYMQLSEKFDWPLRKPAIIRALKTAFVPGRMQFIRPLFEKPAILLDGAHNPHSFAALDKNIQLYGLRPRSIIFNCMTDKQLDAVLPMFSRWTEGPIFIPPIINNPRAADPNLLASKIGPQAIPAASLKKAIQLASEVAPRAATLAGEQNLPEELRCPVLICGSLYLLGKFFEIYPHLLEPSNLH